MTKPLAIIAFIVSCLSVSAAYAVDAGRDAGRDAGARDAGTRAVNADAGSFSTSAIKGVDAGAQRSAAAVPSADAPSTPPVLSPDDPIVLVREPPTEVQVNDAVEATDLLVRGIVGLCVLVFLAYLGSARPVRRLEERLGLTQLITAGFVFVALGLLARQVGVLSEPILLQLTPVMQFGLGWLGFVVGFRFDVRVLDRAPAGTALAIGLTTAIPFAAIAIATSFCLVLFGDVGWGDSMKAAFALGTAGAMTAPRIGRKRSWFLHDDDNISGWINRLDEIAGVVGLALLASYFRPGAALTWELTGTAWLFITLGLGMTVGLVAYTALSVKATGSEFVAIALGSVAFAAGMAGYLHLSPLVVAFVAGTLVTNLPFTQKDRLASTLAKIERPILLLFLSLAGAVWDVAAPLGWLLVPIFLFARLVGKFSALVALRAQPIQSIPVTREARLVFAPISVLSIAVVLSVQSLYREQTTGWIVTAVIGGAIISEILLQLFGLNSAQSEEESPS